MDVQLRGLNKSARASVLHRRRNHYTCGMESDRYSRQQAVRHLGAESEAAFASAHVLMIGAGGLGCTVAPLLAGAGIGHLTIVDHDTVALSNLHRQTWFDESDIGQAKATCMAKKLRALNSSVQIEAVVERCSPRNVTALVKSADVVIDAADNFALTYLLSDACETYVKPLVAASVNGTFGNLAVYCGDPSLSLPSYRDVFPKVPDRLVSCDIVGVTGPSVAAMGALQAQLVLKILMRQSTPAVLYQFELWNFSMFDVTLTKTPTVTSSNTPTTLVKNSVDRHPNELAQENSVGRHDKKKNVDVQMGTFLSSACPNKGERVEFLVENEISSQLVIDVRDPQEVKKEPLRFDHVVNIPLKDLSTDTRLDESAVWVFACRSGQRALIAAQRMQKNKKSIYVLMPS